MHAGRTLTLLFGLILTTIVPAPSLAADWFVANGGTGNGTASAPFGRIQDALSVAQPGDFVTVAAGTYTESLRSVRSGSSTQPIVIRPASGRGSVIVTTAGRVLTVGHSYLTIDSLVLDGQYGFADLVRVNATGQGFTLRSSEVRRTTLDAIDIGAAADVLIEDSLIHHALNAARGRTDAHGVVAGAVRHLTIRNTEIHTFSGDGVQVDPGRAAPGWSDVLIEGCRIWLAPLPEAENGFAAGAVPGENAIDTKAAAGFARAKIVMKNVQAFGFQGGLISNMAAFNLKENIDALVDGATVYDSEIAFRLRGPGPSRTGALVNVQNAVVYNTAYAFRYEDDIHDLRIWNVTIGGGVSRPFAAASSAASELDVRNVLLLGSALPLQATGPSNLAVDRAAFVNATAHNYQLAAGSPAIDRGASLSGVATDRQGTARPQGSAYDIGAYERGSTTKKPGLHKGGLRREPIRFAKDLGLYFPKVNGAGIAQWVIGRPYLRESIRPHYESCARHGMPARR